MDIDKLADASDDATIEVHAVDPMIYSVYVLRDGERTPMQWEPGAGAGFTAADPWLPLAEDADRRNVAAQREDPRSLLHLYRELIALRRATPALHRGSYRTLDAPDGVFAYERRTGESTARIALNFADTPARVALGGGAVRGSMSACGATTRPRGVALPGSLPAGGIRSGTVRPCGSAPVIRMPPACRPNAEAI